MGWNGMGWNGMGWDGMEWDGMGWDGSLILTNCQFLESSYTCVYTLVSSYVKS